MSLSSCADQLREFSRGGGGGQRRGIIILFAGGGEGVITLLCKFSKFEFFGERGVS